MLESLKFQARIQGVETEDEDAPKSKKDELGATMVFKDPKEYEHLSKEEKKELTAKMKGLHRQNIKLG